MTRFEPESKMSPAASNAAFSRERVSHFFPSHTHSSLYSFLSHTKHQLISLCYIQTMPVNRDPSSPPPVIGKMGPYTIFITPPPTPHPPEPLFDSPKKVVSPPPVLPPPVDKSLYASHSDSQPSVPALLRNAVTKLQTAHSSLDEHLARWFGLNQSKYQWALDDYLENKGLGKEGAKVKEMSSKIQNV